MGETRAVKVRQTRRALAQIDQVLIYVEARSPRGAIRLRDRVTALIALMQEQPRVGQATSHPNIRRLPVSPYPYLIDYRVTSTEIIIMRFRDAARRPLG